MKRVLTNKSINQMKLLNRDALLKKQELQIKKVDLGNDEFIYVREMTGHERDTFERSLYVFDKNNKPITRIEDFRAKLAVCTVCDEKGELLLKPSDYIALSNSMGAARLEKIVNEAQTLNKISEEDKEQLVKNSDAVPDGSSNSGYAENLE